MKHSTVESRTRSIRPFQAALARFQGNLLARLEAVGSPRPSRLQSSYAASASR